MKKNLQLVLIVIGVVLAVVIVKAILFVTGKPKVTVDYVAEYNAITFPSNYDPNENAAPYYQKAFDAFVERPQQLGEAGKRWLADFNDTELVLLQKWSASNSPAFEQFKIGAKKPYYWWQRQATHGSGMSELIHSEQYPLRQMIIMFTWKTKEDAIEGRTQAVFDNILDCYRVGCQQCRTPSLLAEQELGLSLKGITMSAALVILDKTEFDGATLKSFQDMLKTELDKDTYLPDLKAEKLLLYDLLQRTFVDNSKGTGRIAWSRAKIFIGACGRWNTFEVLEYCLIGPTRNQMVKQIDDMFAYFDSIKTKTPKQLYDYDRNYFMKIDISCENDLFLGLSAINPHRVYDLYHETRSRAEAVITVIAILRYKADMGRYPASLDKLVSAGYMQSVPMDPYSDGPLVYKVTGNNFKLYSVGENFKDDSGESADSADIVYWPFKRPERLKPALETEKPIQKLAEPNQPK